MLEPIDLNKLNEKLASVSVQDAVVINIEELAASSLQDVVVINVEELAPASLRDAVVINIEELEKSKEQQPTIDQPSSCGWPILSHFFSNGKSHADERTPLLENAKHQALIGERAQRLIDQCDAEQEANSFILVKLLRKFRLDAQQPQKDKQQLPNELLLHVLSYLSPKELTIIAQVCRELNALADDVSLWKRHARRDYPFFQQQINAAPSARLKYQYRNQLIRDGKIFNSRAELREMVQQIEAEYQNKINSGMYSAMACLAIAGVAGGVWLYQKGWGNNSVAKNVSPYIALVYLGAVVLIGIVTVLRLLNEALSTYGKNKEINHHNRSTLRYNAKVIEEFGETLDGNVLRH